MLCEKAEVSQVEQGLFDDGVWIAQQKFDGIRAYVCKGKLFSRRGKEITHLFPEFNKFLKQIAETDLIYDGEIVSESGEFNDVSGRIHLKDKLFIKVASSSNPATFMLFDCFTELSRNDDEFKVNASLRTFIDRYKLVAVHSSLKTSCDDRIQIAKVDEKPSDLLEFAKKEGWEGIVMKKKYSLYYNGRSLDWRKVKLFKEVKHSFSEYTEHPKGILLKDGDRKVNVNGKQAEIVKTEIANKGCVVVEVQFLPQYNNDKWRFPSFRGIAKEVNQ